MSCAYFITPSGNKSQVPIEAHEGRVRIMHGDIQTPTFFEAVFKKHGVTATFVCLTGENKLMSTLNFFDAMRRAGSVKYWVYLSAYGDFDLGAI
ncbi:hypothetical protein HD806DRAFT_533094 [Xylariaceae sp. AK1471]|nr:hypothetical protein HD806DRAFT_533094 [Xylariaceae sp. AK1471]